MSDGLTRAEGVQNRSKNIVTEDTQVSEGSKSALLGGASGYKDRNKDSAYFEDVESVQCAESECLSKKILSIIDPDHRSTKFYSYTFTITGSDGENSVTSHGNVSQQSHLNNEEIIKSQVNSASNPDTPSKEGSLVVDTVSPDRETLSASFDAASVDLDLDILDEDRNIGRDCNSSTSSESLPWVTARSAKNDIVCIVEVHRADSEEIDDPNQDPDRDAQSKTLGETSPSNEENKQSVSGIEKTTLSAGKTLAEPGDSPKSSTCSGSQPKCDWFLPSPVQPYYAGVCNRHVDRGDNNVEDKSGHVDASLTGINFLMLRLLCFLADVEHIDSWLRHNAERQCVDLHTLTQSVSHSSTSWHDLHPYHLSFGVPPPLLL